MLKLFGHLVTGGDWTKVFKASGCEVSGLGGVLLEMNRTQEMNRRLTIVVMVGDGRRGY